MVEAFSSADKASEAVHLLLALQAARIALVRATDQALFAAKVDSADFEAILHSLEALADANRRIKDFLDLAAIEAADAVSIIPVRRAAGGDKS